ncbi:hypothetical protein NE237_002928 [Protea cynaroides]|uniref:Uncharacterized protein n=1 Tax=Protea cynaroides TaxID=273540 RepID=A0A9Q0KG37_9MAGN|nr:hypothetical protein NE237_002928 [Protea cynaroides]
MSAFDSNNPSNLPIWGMGDEEKDSSEACHRRCRAKKKANRKKSEAESEEPLLYSLGLIPLVGSRAAGKGSGEKSSGSAPTQQKSAIPSSSLAQAFNKSPTLTKVETEALGLLKGGVLVASHKVKDNNKLRQCGLLVTLRLDDINLGDLLFTGLAPAGDLAPPPTVETTLAATVTLAG